jgi:hypothetical protein
MGKRRVESDMGMDEAREKVLAVWPDAHVVSSPVYDKNGTQTHFKQMAMGARSRSGNSYTFLGQGLTEHEAWIDAASKLPALRPVEEMEVDWESDEAVVRAAYENDWNAILANNPMGARWSEARFNDASVKAFERQNNPKYAAVPELAPTPSEPDTAGGVDNADCAKCHATMSTAFGMDRTKYCNSCAQDLVAEYEESVDSDNAAGQGVSGDDDINLADAFPAPVEGSDGFEEWLGPALTPRPTVEEVGGTNHKQKEAK